MIEKNIGLIDLKEVYHEKPYCDYIKKMCSIRDEEVKGGEQASSVMNMLLMILKKINYVREDVLEWLSEHYCPDWQVMRNLIYFVNKKAAIDWFQVFEGILEKWQQNYQYVILFLTECQKAFELQMEASDINVYVEKSRNPHEFALMLSKAEKILYGDSQEEAHPDAGAGEDGIPENNDNVIRDLTESIEFYKKQCAMQQAEIEALSRYKMQHELLSLKEEEGSQPDLDAVVREKEQAIHSLKEENRQLRRECSSFKEQCEQAQLEIERLKGSQEGSTPDGKEEVCGLDMPGMPVPDKKVPLLSGLLMAAQQKRFQSLDEVKQREDIISYVMKCGIADKEYILLLKQLMDNPQIGLSFIFRLVKCSAKKEELRNALLLLDTLDAPKTEKLEENNAGSVGNGEFLETGDSFLEEDEEEGDSFWEEDDEGEE